MTGMALTAIVLCMGLMIIAAGWRARALRIEDAVRNHRDQYGGDRCWKDDADLYAVLPEGHVLPQVFEVGDKVAMLKECEQYIQRRCFEGGVWKSNADWEAELNAAIADVTTLNRQISQQLEHGALWTEHGPMLRDWFDLTQRIIERCRK